MTADLKKALGAIELPEFSATVAALGKVRAAEVSGNRATAAVELGVPFASIASGIRESLVEALIAATKADTAEVELTCRIVAHGVQPSLKPLDGVRNVIAVASGKGGVGKSTVASNLALALSADGARVGVLDADIYGPSQPIMFGLAGKRPLSEDGKTMQPLEAHGVAVMSIGFLIDSDQPMAWRGPMVTSALDQLLRQTAWDDLDYLIVDMPPGTGDIQLTLSQRVPVSGAVIVTTPQDIALADARKGLQLFRKVSIPVLGVVENMSTHRCSACGHEEAIFGRGGGQRMAEDYDVTLLGQLPLDLSIREQTDGGRPTVAATPESAQARAFVAAARRTSAALAQRGRDYSTKFPKIVVEDS
ncbi:MAG: iron-sulfur cluster carrier protein ApbC [Woeseiaceae bacterium]|nr:iron-sulfur cluster carrier protein ApbC [Woeseiaceae bacterium]